MGAEVIVEMVQEECSTGSGGQLDAGRKQARTDQDEPPRGDCFHTAQYAAGKWIPMVWKFSRPCTLAKTHQRFLYTSRVTTQGKLSEYQTPVQFLGAYSVAVLFVDPRLDMWRAVAILGSSPHLDR